VDFEAKRLAAVAAARIGFVDGHFRAVQHGLPEGLVFMVADGAEKADGHFADF
jgi:hypothetical protein